MEQECVIVPSEWIDSIASGHLKTLYVASRNEKSPNQYIAKPVYSTNDRFYITGMFKTDESVYVKVTHVRVYDSFDDAPAVKSRYLAITKFRYNDAAGKVEQYRPFSDAEIATTGVTQLQFTIYHKK